MGATARFGLRWMENTDRLNQVAQRIRELAEDVEAKLYARGDLSTATDADVVTDEPTASTSYGNLATVGPTVTFVAPASGKVRIDWSVRASNSAAAGQALVSFDLAPVTTGAGAVGPSALRALRITGTALNSGSLFYLASGLTPGQSYTAQLRYSSTSGNTATIGHRRLLVEPR